MFIVGSIAVAIGIIGATALLLMFWSIFRSLSAGFGFVAMTFVLETIWGRLPSIDVGLNVFPTDLVFVMFALTAMIRFLTVRSIREIPRLWLLFGTLLMLSFAVGLPKNGTYAGVDFREYFYLFAATVYVMSFAIDQKSIASMVNWWITAAFLICVIAAYRWSMMAAGLEDYAWLDTTGFRGRVVHSEAALGVASAIVMMLFTLVRQVGSRAWLWLFPIALTVIIGVQHRTVWMALATGIVLVFVKAREGRGTMLATLTLVSCLLGGTAVLLFKGGPLEEAGTALRGSATAGLSTESGTFVGRLVGWKALLRDYAGYGPLHMLIGKPFGSGYARMQGGKEVGYNPHNYYIQTLLRTGAVGLAALLGTYVLVMRRLGRLSLRGLGRHGDMFWVLLAVQLVFDIAYGLPWSQSIILGMAMALSVQYGAGRSTQTATVDEAPRRLAHVP